ncbi:MAG: ATP-binding protein [bacterium]|nr:ATP-binding protein [bacterium]
MKQKRLFWQLYPGLVAVIVVALFLSALYATRETRRLYLDEIETTLIDRGSLVKMQLVDISISDQPAIDSLCKQLGRVANTRITIVDSAGVVLGDSREDPSMMENHGLRPEISGALKGQTTSRSRFSNTLQINMLYVAQPVMDEGKTVGVVRTSLPMDRVDLALTSLYWKLALSGLIISLLAGIVGLVLIRRVTNSLEDLRLGAERFAKGELDTRLPVPSGIEVGSVALAMNEMASQLDRRISMVMRQRNEREAILSSMTEGVIALDRNEKIVSLNDAAAALLKIESPANVIGSSIHELLRHRALIKLLGEAEGGIGTGSTEVQISSVSGAEQSLLINSARLIDSGGEQMGTVLVLSDITRIRKLEIVRKDFVANVSHELRTPITAIKGAVETILSSNLSMNTDADRFLQMVNKHADRMSSIIEDLLSLARLEDEQENGSSEEYPTSNILEIIKSSVQSCQAMADAKSIEINYDADVSFPVKVNRLRMEQAISNLIENAVKYSDNGSVVKIKVEQEGDEITISVIDSGWGIEPQHLPRLFERFYRVDSARTREIGGTGLGLAIVRHIAISHGGRVSVESRHASGSCFRIHLPATS